MSLIIDSEYGHIINVFNIEKASFEKRKSTIEELQLTSVNWSNAYLDFFPYNSIIDQLKPAVIYKEAKPASIKNHYAGSQLLYAVNNENEAWGTVFVDYADDMKKWLLFVENDDEEMVLQLIKIAYFENGKYTKAVSYLNDEDADEETLIIDFFEYHADEFKTINRYGFYEEPSKILPDQEFSFSYDNNLVEVCATDSSGKKVSIYKGKKLR